MQTLFRHILCLGMIMTTNTMQKTPLAAAYYYHDEPEFNRLRNWFAKDTKNTVPEVEVIVISSSSEEPIYSSEDIEYMDVNYPVVFTNPIVRRKLFDEDDPATHMESPPSPHIHFIYVALAVWPGMKVESSLNYLLPAARVRRTPLWGICGPGH